MRGRALSLAGYFLLVTVVLSLSLAVVGPSQAANKSHNNKDFVAIRKITPCSGADIPTPCKFPLTMEIGYKLASAPKGKLRVGVFLRQPGSKAANLINSRLGKLQPLLPYIEKDIVKGDNVTTITTDPVDLPKAVSRNMQMIVVVNIHNGAHKELCWATSYNFLRGTLAVRTTRETPDRDSLQVMSYAPLPKAGPLYTGRSHSFSVNMQYSLRTQKWGFVNLELCNQANNTAQGVWYITAIPLQKGTGTVTVTTRDYFFPVNFSGRSLMLNIPFRVKPLGGTLDVLNFGPWPLQRPH